MTADAETSKAVEEKLGKEIPLSDYSSAASGEVKDDGLNTALKERMRAEIRAELEAEAVAEQAAAAQQKLASQGTVHLIHFIEDGFTALETMWFRGQELEVVEGSAEWKQTLMPTPECRESLVANPNTQKHADPCNCESWMNMSDAQQYRKYKSIKFRQGPWPGEQWEDEVRAKEENRRRKVPAPIATLR